MYQSMEEEITFYGPNSTYRTTMDFSEIVEKWQELFKNAEMLYFSISDG